MKVAELLGACHGGVLVVEPAQCRLPPPTAPPVEPVGAAAGSRAGCDSRGHHARTTGEVEWNIKRGRRNCGPPRRRSAISPANRKGRPWPSRKDQVLTTGLPTATR